MVKQDDRVTRQAQADKNASSRSSETLGGILGETIENTKRPQEGTVFKLASEIENNRDKIRKIDADCNMAELRLIEMLVKRENIQALQVNWTFLRLQMKRAKGK